MFLNRTQNVKTIKEKKYILNYITTKNFCISGEENQKQGLKVINHEKNLKNTYIGIVLNVSNIQKGLTNNF